MLRIGAAVITEIDPRSLSDDEIDELTAFGHVLERESAPDDPVTPLDVGRAWHRTIPGFIVLREFVARDGDGRVVARCSTSWAKREENQHILGISIGVAPDHRRRALGTELLRLASVAADDAGKRLMMFSTTDRVPPAEAFARAIGAEAGLVGHTNRLLTADVDRELILRWAAEGPGRAPGYSLVSLDGRYPDELIEQILDLSAVMNTAPRDKLDVEDNIPNVEYEREHEKSFFATGAECWRILAREVATDRLVGWTEVGWWPHEPDTVWQFGTGVRPEHRGRALGKWLKATMLQRILDEAPDVVDVRTHNADSNDPMLGINHEMGFAPYRTDINWQLKLEDAKAYLANI